MPLAEFEPAIPIIEQRQTHVLYLVVTGIGTIKVYRMIVLSFVLYGCETWSLTLREDSRLRVFERGEYLGLRGTR
jgi:hypothetical protein